MRFDVKTVKNRKYLQFVDSKGEIFHIGSASDFDSWLICAILWNNEWQREYAQRREDFFDLIEYEMNRNAELDSSKLSAFEAVRLQDKYPNRLDRPLRVPKISLFGLLRENPNNAQRRFRPYVWCPSEWGSQIQKRLNEIQRKKEQLQRKYKSSNRSTEKRQKLEEIRNLRKKARESALKEERTVLSVIIEMEKETRIVETKKLFDELTRRYKTSREENEQTLCRLLREGVIYEPREGYLLMTIPPKIVFDVLEGKKETRLEEDL